MLWCSLDNELITLPVSHYGGRVVNASDYGNRGTRSESLWSPISVFISIFLFDCFFSSAAVKRLRTRD